MDWPVIIGRNMRDLRKQRGLSQEQAAVDAGIDTSWWGRAERGEINPTVAVLEKIATTLNVSLPELFEQPKLAESTRAAVKRAVKKSVKRPA